MKPASPLIASAVLALLCTPASAQVQPTWSQAPGGVMVSRDAADNVFTARWDANLGGDIVLTKRSPAGALLWEVAHDNTDTTRSEAANWLATDGNGNTYVAGTIRSGFSNPVAVNALLMKFSPTGQLLWRRVLGAPFDGSSGLRVVLDAQGNAHVFGLGQSGTGQVSTVHKLAPDSSLLWTWYDQAGIGYPQHAKLTPDQHLLVTARGVTGLFNGFARIDPQGTTLWTRAGVSSPTVGDAAGDAQGNTYLVNGAPVAGSSVLQKLSSSGALLWQRTAALQAMRVELGLAGSAVLAGLPPAGAGAAFAAFSANGDPLWLNADADGPLVNQLLHSQLLVDAAGNAYLGGSTLFQSSVTQVLADGRTGYSTQFGSGAVSGLALGSAGQLYVSSGISISRIDSGSTPPPPPPPPLPTTIDLALSLSAAPTSPRVGDNLVYSGTVRNRGTGPAADVRYTLTLPSQVAWRRTVTSQGSCSGATVVNCTLSGLAAQGSATVTVTVQARKRGTVAAQASTSTSGRDVDSSNNAASISTTIRR